MDYTQNGYAQAIYDFEMSIVTKRNMMRQEHHIYKPDEYWEAVEVLERILLKYWKGN